MKDNTALAGSSSNQHQRFIKGIARALAGAIIFSLPLIMTMEMWWLAFYMDRFRLALLLFVTALLLVGLARYAGFEETTSWVEQIVDAFVGYAIGFIAAAIFLPMLGIIEPGMSPDEIIGKISLQAVPGSMGALLARSQLSGDRNGNTDDKNQSYGGELFLMLAGALFLALNLAPTEEMILIAFRMTPWHALALILTSLVVMHAFIYNVQFRGQEEPPASLGFWALFLRFTVVGYAMVLLASLYILWTFGRTDATAYGSILMMTVVLGFPGAVGAAAARLIL